MSESAALLAAIRQAPDDDAPRLIYADWLDKNGQPERAEFIRVQIELERNELTKMREREAELIKRHGDTFAGQLFSPGLQFQFRRGFVSSLGHAGLYVTDYDESKGFSRTLQFFSDGRLIDGLLGTAVEPLPFETTIEQLAEHFRTKFRGTVQHAFQLEEVSWEYCPRLAGSYELEAIEFPADIRITFQLDEAETSLHGAFRGSSLVLEFNGPSGVRQLQQIYKHVSIPALDSR